MKLPFFASHMPTSEPQSGTSANRAWGEGEVNECQWRWPEFIPLWPKAYAVLKYFIQRPSTLVTKHQLLDDVWPNTFVSDAVLKDCIRQLREALDTLSFLQVPLLVA